MSAIEKAIGEVTGWISSLEISLKKDEPSKPTKPLPLEIAIQGETQLVLTPLQRLTIASSSPFSGFPKEDSCKIG